MAQDWLANRRSEIAGDAILDAAAELFAARGVDSVAMSDIAQAAGCSRPTLYRYFENRRTLLLAFVQRETLRIAERIRERTSRLPERRDRIATAISTAIESVRETPTLTAWFAGGEGALATELAQSSSAMRAFAAAVLTDDPDSDADLDLKVQWAIRVIISLLTVPAGSPAAEHELITKFVVPVLLDSPVDAAGSGSGRDRQRREHR
ncbi:TetR/AcrR family transcriptional regulator [Nocardia sp. NPDC088792]|uniref:TetR/AcrR family transcriptional regulator n=1 Tax=Nocardia sp. NPDC088792 TaxID=3364332 RepID=UPI003825F932